MACNRATHFIDSSLEHQDETPNKLAVNDKDDNTMRDQSTDKSESLHSSPTKKAKGKSHAKLKKRAWEEMFDAAIEKVTAAQQANDE